MARFPRSSSRNAPRREGVHPLWACISHTIDEKTLLDALFAGRATLADRVEKHMSPPLPIVGSGEAVSAAVAQLGGADALLVHVDGKPAGVVTRQDVLGHIAGLAPTVGS